ncbi:MAG: hypothetical protein DWQ47_03990 [Acidobacteria bacterium]|nr:MAG: hypothetical protein DWQ32_07540 [Acidobacteriota bacterium]REK01556.1 MAG: hypothetical protein DWQ38_03975 [Acidobacteriota bacterium]REK14512.1 MAG: hypothetical protein DWQ43_13230 [Acidobacteriota bacterium]REK45227.1 MAG: hypothetical protein DWQ47_03990 [Acidobacteriota bacterium]
MQNTRAEAVVGTGNSVEFDTSFIVFFLAMEIGRTGSIFALENIVMLPALVAVMVAPFYFLPEDMSYSRWFAGRAVIAGLGLIIGAAFGAAVGPLFPEVFSFLPFTFLVMASMVTAFLSFASLLRFEEAR